MNELTQHIERLLVTNDCVIVPGLGGFVTQYVTARRVDDENLFLPPYRTVGFNAQLTMNDGLLVQAFMQSYDTSYPETVRLVEDKVAEVKRCLHTEGVYELEGIGVLKLKLDGCYDFVPCEAGVLSPEHYGLSSFTMSEIQVVEKATAAFKTPTWQFLSVSGSRKKTEPKSKKNDYVLHVNRNVVNYTVAAVAAVVFYCFFSLPLGNPTISSTNEASISSGMVFGLSTLASSSDISQKEVTPVHSSNKNDEVTDVESADKEQEQPESIKKESKGAYTIVLASAVAQKSAEAYVNDLHKSGLKDARIYTNKSMVRVVYANYLTEVEAHDALRLLRKQNVDFSDAWVMRLPV